MRLKLTVLLLSLCSIASLSAQDYNFRSISLDDGLSQSSINAIEQDQKGFVWFGTQDGLNRFDGINFKIYKKNPFDNHSISGNHITAILEDRQGRLWVGTRENGLNLFDAKQDAFIRFQQEENNTNSIVSNNINFLYEDDLGQIWLGTSHGICKVILKENERDSSISFQRYQVPNSDKSISTNQSVEVLFRDSRGAFWLGTKQGLFRYEQEVFETRGFDQHMDYQVKDLDIDLVNNPVYSICEDRQANIWLATQEGVLQFDYSEGRFKQFEHPAGEAINTLLQARDGSIMMAGKNGLFKVPFENDSYDSTLIDYTNQYSRLENIATKAISIIQEDNSYNGLFWLGTKHAGVVRMYKLKKDFLSDNLSYINPIPPSVKYILKDDKENIWIGLKDALLIKNEVTTTHQLIKHIDTDQGSIACQQIRFIFKNKNGDLWAGMNQGGILELSLNKKMQVTGKFVESLQEACHDKPIFAMYEDGQVYYLGSYHGIYVLHKNNLQEKIERLSLESKYSQNPDYTVLSFLKDRSQNLWVGTNYGLMLYENLKDGLTLKNRKASAVFHYNKDDQKTLPDNQIYDIIEDGSGNIWLATNNGMTKVYQTEEGYAFKNYKEEHGLANNVIYGILEDEESACLWTSSNNGLARFDPKIERFNNFNYKDGLQSNEFNPKAFFKSKEGKMFFGGANGYTHFYPESIILENKKPFVWITALHTLDGEVFEFLAEDNNRRIELSHDQNSFYIKFIGIDYLCPRRVNYYYDLEGGDALDIPNGTSRQVNFSKLSPGEYTFRVKASNRTGIVNNEGDHIAILIQAPFWQTSKFYLFLISFVGLLFWCIYHVRYKFKLQKIADFERIRKSAAEDFHDELGSKLSIISLYGELTKQQLKSQNPKAQLYLNKVIDNSNSLYSSMKDLLWTLNPDEDSIHDLFIQLQTFGEELFYHSGIEFNTYQCPDELNTNLLPMNHKRHILLVFKEAMNNALKHAHCEQADLRLMADKHNFSIEFIDNGIGFDPTRNGIGEGLRNMKTRAQKISGRLLVEPLLQGTGTRIKLICPLM